MNVAESAQEPRAFFEVIHPHVFYARVLPYVHANV